MKNVSTLALVSLFLWPTAASADQVILDDLIIDGSTCVGFDCVNGESFQFDTLRLKENNLRIRFVDTSTSAAFPSNDWQLVANDSNNGGQDRFSIEDLTGGVTPFTLRAGAGNHALYVAAAGVGLGTATPERALHLSVGDTPTLRLQQTAALGWPAQTWDVGGNESSFFIRDTTVDALPLRILPGGIDDTLVLAPAGSVGVGTASPLVRLHVADDGPVLLRYEDRAGASTWEESYDQDAWALGEVGGATAITVADNGDVTIGGTLAQGSSRKIKRNIVDVDAEAILAKVDALNVSRWRYRHDASAEHIGPMAEEFHEAFGVGPDNEHIAPADLAGIAVASSQALHRKLTDQAAAIDRLERENVALKRQLARIEALLDAR